MPSTTPEKSEKPATAVLALVDDSFEDTFLLRRALRKHAVPADVLVCENGPAFLAHLEAVEAGREEPPALVLMDVNMPLMSGHEVLANMRARPAFAEVPALVMVSDRNARHDIEQAMAVGATDCVVKPANNAENSAFCQRVCELLPPSG